MKKRFQYKDELIPVRNGYKSNEKKRSQVSQYAKQRVFTSQCQQLTDSNYEEYLSTLSLGALQKQLVVMRQKQKKFSKLNQELKLLQKKSNLIGNDSKKLISLQNNSEDQEIVQLKTQIEQVNNNIKRMVEERKVIKKQCTESTEQISRLEEELYKLRQTNEHFENKIKEKREKLLLKSRTVQELKQIQLQNQNQVRNLYQQIKSLEQQSHLLQSELHALLEEKQAKDRNKQKLQKIVSQLEKELLRQKDHEQQTQFKLYHTQTLKQDLQQELINLRNKEELLIQEYEAKVEEYHTVTLMAKQSDIKILNLQDELFMVENDIYELNQQFIHQAELLKEEEIQNAAINQEFDNITKQAIDVWSSICQLIKIQEQSNRYQNTNGPSMQSGEGNSTNQIKFKALKIWKDIESIINIDQNL